MRTQMAQIAYAVTGAGGPIPVTWNVGTLTATTVNTTNFSATSFTPTTVTATGAITGSQFVPTGAAVPTVGMYLPAANALALATNSTIRLRINSDGGLLYNTTVTNPITAGVIGTSIGAVNNNMIINGSATPLSVGFLGAGTLVNWFAGPVSFIGSVSTDGFGTSYNTTSDQRLKVKIGCIEYLEAADVIERISALWFRWKDGDVEPTPGFFAQQAYRICPWAVTKGRGRPGSKNFVPWQMDACRLMPFVIAYIQGLGKRVAKLEKAVL